MAAQADAPGAANTNGVVFWPVLVLVLLVDLVTKAVAVSALTCCGFPYEIVGDRVRLTLVYNPGAAFGLHLGAYSRWIFLALTAVVLRVLWHLYRRTPDRANGRVLAIALVMAGALGNAVDRLRSSQGVIDFLDVGVGAWRWPTFNVADVAVTTGAALLAWTLWGEEDEAPAHAASAPLVPAPDGADASRPAS